MAGPSRLRAASRGAWPPTHSAWELPTKGDLIVLDIGTSVVAEGKVRVLYNKGQKAPDGWLLDNQGKPTNDPGVLYKEPPGTILLLGGASLQGVRDQPASRHVHRGPVAACSTPGAPNLTANAVLFIVLDVNQFAGGDISSER